jgi:hypothetical protein
MVGCCKVVFPSTMSLVEARPKRGAATKARELIARIAVGENVDFQRERDATAAASSSSAETKKKRKANAAKSSASEPKKKRRARPRPTWPRSPRCRFGWPPKF